MTDAALALASAAALSTLEAEATTAATDADEAEAASVVVMTTGRSGRLRAAQVGLTRLRRRVARLRSRPWRGGSAQRGQVSSRSQRVQCAYGRARRCESAATKGRWRPARSRIRRWTVRVPLVHVRDARQTRDGASRATRRRLDPAGPARAALCAVPACIPWSLHAAPRARAGRARTASPTRPHPDSIHRRSNSRAARSPTTASHGTDACPAQSVAAVFASPRRGRGADRFVRSDFSQLGGCT